MSKADWWAAVLFGGITIAMGTFLIARWWMY